MLLEKMITAVDSHTEGMPTRVVTGGFPAVPGESMFDKQRYAREHLDHLRRTLVFEPRGHSAMVSAILLPPVDLGADLGVLFVDEMGYLPMCGHGTIGVCTVAVETGLVEANELLTRLTLDTPAGSVAAEAKVEGGRVQSVRFRNVPAFVQARDVEVSTPSFGRLTVDIAYGGNFFAILPAESVDLALDRRNSAELVEAGMEIMASLAEQVTVSHPLNPEINEVKHVVFTGAAEGGTAHARNATVIYPGMLDRSPCGTGTSARMARLFERGELGLDENFVHESIIGTLFTGRLEGQTELAEGVEAVVPTIEGRAWVHGFQQLVVDPEDPFPAGFALR